MSEAWISIYVNSREPMVRIERAQGCSLVSADKAVREPLQSIGMLNSHTSSRGWLDLILAAKNYYSSIKRIEIKVIQYLFFNF